MSIAYAVVGANYGDEGKGLLVDFLASKLPDAKVVRFSGGAQAGHTVVTPEGKRHVFGHFGAGTIAGNVTYLSRYFIVNPMLFEREYKELLDKGIVPKIEIDQACMVTTPWDMIINRIVARGKSMSCGVGINETVTRFEKSPFKFTIGHETKVDLEGMYKDYFYQRLEELGVKDIPVHFKEILEIHHNLKSNFNDSMEYMLDKCIVVNGMPKDQDIIFEGSQGLLLDPDYGVFPYVTRASVGIKNAVVLAKEAKIDNFHSIYVTRCYLTRHGAGPLPNEIDPPEIEEKTNILNPWQGKLRFAPLDLQELRGRISYDSTQSMCIFPYDFSNIKRTVAVTCMDHYSKISNSSSKEFAASLQTDLSHSLILAEGPTRNDVTTKWINHTTNLGDI